LRIIFEEILSLVESQSFPAPYFVLLERLLSASGTCPTGPPRRPTVALNTIWRQVDAIFMPDTEDNNQTRLIGRLCITNTMHPKGVKDEQN